MVQQGKRCLPKLTTIYGEMTGLGDEGSAVAAVHLDMRKPLCTVCKNSFMEKLKEHGLAQQTTR